MSEPGVDIAVAILRRIRETEGRDAAVYLAHQMLFACAAIIKREQGTDAVRNALNLAAAACSEIEAAETRAH
jgi:hypothetical protein